MKRYAFILCLLVVFAIALNAHSKPDFRELPVMASTTMRSYNPRNLAEVEAVSEYIVRGYLLNDTRLLLQYGASSEFKDEIVDGYSISTLVITEAYRGDLSAGDRISLVERYWVGDYQNTQVLFTTDHYQPMVPGNEYVLFLGRQADDAEFEPGAYFPKCVELSVYPVGPAKVSASALDSLTLQDYGLNKKTGKSFFAMYKGIHAEVAAKYLAD